MVKKKSIGSETGSDRADGTAAEPAKPYVVLARKYRPQTFDDLIGQEAMVTTLRNAFRSGRIAQGYMLTGVRGVGKTTTARILARALNYETDVINAPTVDMAAIGRHCTEIMESRHPDVVEMDAASNTGVDNIREIIESARYRPILARTKVFIIDEVHMLSKGAFNALLKTLEEPPVHVKFIFATTEIRKVPVTVLSRCQRFDLRRVSVAELTSHFRRIAEAEGAKSSDDALALISRAAEGSVRDGLSILDQAIAMGEGNVATPAVRAMLGLADRGRIFDQLEQIFSGDIAGALTSAASLYRDGAEPHRIIADLAESVHLVARLKVAGGAASTDVYTIEELSRASAMAERLSVPLLSRAWQMLLKGFEEVARAPDAMTAAEMVLIRLGYTADLPSPDELIKLIGGEPKTPVQSLSNDGGGRQPSTGSTINEARPVPVSAKTFETAQSADTFDERSNDDGENEIDDLVESSEGEANTPHASSPQPRSFADVIALAGVKRDAMLKINLEDRVSLVKFDARTKSIDLFLLPGAPSEIANDLREKLNVWTGQRWMVMLSKAAGEPAVGAVRREREAAEFESLKAHPAVRAVLDVFPDATITAVRPGVRATRDDDDSSATG